MTTARIFMVTAYATAFTVAAYCGAQAITLGQDLSAAGLFAASVMLLAGIRREFLAAAAELTAGRTAATETADCCETWWTSLGTRHDQHCKAPVRKDT
ncbi:hypothetical protein ACFY0N_00765 [Streptomyces vinaceus]|uniref:hypothetical protein n=1 Tax=Streptomyces vinaceus TaxID=1960 RepID=UPI0036A3A361